MRIDIVTIFPDLVSAVGEFGVARIARERSILKLHLWNPRDYCEDSYRRVDDRPYGGGPGMVMQAPPLAAAIREARQASGGRVIGLSPQGSPLSQATVERLAGEPALVLLAGRYIYRVFWGMRNRPRRIHSGPACWIGHTTLGQKNLKGTRCRKRY